MYYVRNALPHMRQFRLLTTPSRLNAPRETKNVRSPFIFRGYSSQKITRKIKKIFLGLPVVAFAKCGFCIDTNSLWISKFFTL